MVSGDLHVGTFRKFIATSVEVCFITESSAYSTFTKQNIMNWIFLDYFLCSVGIGIILKNEFWFSDFILHWACL
jgi:uncharacterized membrane protein (DUF106 family)